MTWEHLFGCAVLLLVAALAGWWWEAGRRQRLERHARESDALWAEVYEVTSACVEAWRCRAQVAERSIARMTGRTRCASGRFAKRI